MARVTRGNSPKPDKAKKEHKVAKRPSRGYHKFRNGLLNVTPKGSEKDITEANRSSPLLQLPAEIRNAIWEFALGGLLLRPLITSQRGRRRELRVSPAEPNGVSLLCVCRQIYAEAATMPLALSIISCDLWNPVPTMKRLLKPHQHKHVTSVQLEFNGSGSFQWMGITLATIYTHDILKLFPALRSYKFCIFRDHRALNTQIALNEEEEEKQVHKLIKAATAGTSVKFEIKHEEQTWSSFDDLWNGRAIPASDDAPAAQSADWTVS
ncbi:hypothetical protein NX059_004027 [Plenodomus lindquistii]|nr:hypothetical protein NX059_004027 [Plenodomus lindquistii]